MGTIVRNPLIVMRSSVRYVEEKLTFRHTKNPPATEISSRGIGVLQVDLQVDITPSALLYHAVMRFLECLRIL